MGDEETDVRARARVGSVLNGEDRLDRVLGVGWVVSVYASTSLRNTNGVPIPQHDLPMAAGLGGRFLGEGP